MQRWIPRGGRRSHVGLAVWVGTGSAVLLLLIAAVLYALRVFPGQHTSAQDLRGTGFGRP